MVITQRATRLLRSLLNPTPLNTFIVRSIATQVFSQPSRYKHNFRNGPMNKQSARCIAKLTVE